MKQRYLKHALTAASVAVIVGMTAVAFATAEPAAGPGIAAATTGPTPTDTPTTPPGEGACTPGFWKNHLDSWQGIAPDTTVGEIWDVAGLDADISQYADTTAEDALSFGGGKGVAGAARIFFRAGVAAVLNASSSSDYPLTVDAIVAAGNTALASGDRQTILDLAGELDDANNQGPCDAGGENTNSG